MDNQNQQSTNPPAENPAIKTPPGQPVQSEIVTPHKSFLSGKLIILIIIFLVVLSGGGTYLALNSKPKPVSAPIVSKSTPASAPTPTPDPTASWKTYTSNKASYSFKYPNDWPINNITPARECIVCIEDIVFSPKYSLTSADSNISVVLVQKEDRIKTLDDYRNIFIKGSPTAYTDVKDVIIDGEKALSFKLSGGTPPLPVIEYIVVKNGFYYEIRLEDSIETNKGKTKNIELFNLFLSTFKFTDVNQATDTSTWKIYTNNQYGFSTKYPQNWGLTENDKDSYNNLKNSVVEFGPILAETPNTHQKVDPFVSPHISIGVIKDSSPAQTIENVLTPMFNIPPNQTPVWTSEAINNFKIVKLVHNGCQNLNCTSYFLRNNENIFEISNWANNGEFIAQILSTFKFTQ